MRISDWSSDVCSSDLPVNPQKRLLMQIIERVRSGAVIAYPTDSCYALGCHLDDRDAADRLRRIRDFDRHHQFTLVCRDLSEIATYARVDNRQFRLLKQLTPGDRKSTRLHSSH